MRRPIVPDAILTRGTSKADTRKVHTSDAVSRDRRFDTPCCLVGYNRNLGWNFTRTALDDEQRAAFVDALCNRYRGIM